MPHFRTRLPGGRTIARFLTIGARNWEIRKTLTGINQWPISCPCGGQPWYAEGRAVLGPGFRMLSKNLVVLLLQD